MPEAALEGLPATAGIRKIAIVAVGVIGRYQVRRSLPWGSSSGGGSSSISSTGSATSREWSQSTEPEEQRLALFVEDRASAGKIPVLIIQEDVAGFIGWAVRLIFVRN